MWRAHLLPVTERRLLPCRIQKKASGRLRGAKATGHGSRSSGEQPQHIKRGQLRANPQRVPESTYSSRPR